MKSNVSTVHHVGMTTLWSRTGRGGPLESIPILPPVPFPVKSCLERQDIKEKELGAKVAGLNKCEAAVVL